MQFFIIEKIKFHVSLVKKVVSEFLWHKSNVKIIFHFSKLAYKFVNQRKLSLKKVKKNHEDVKIIKY